MPLLLLLQPSSCDLRCTQGLEFDFHVFLCWVRSPCCFYTGSAAWRLAEVLLAPLEFTPLPPPPAWICHSPIWKGIGRVKQLPKCLCSFSGLSANRTAPGPSCLARSLPSRQHLCRTQELRAESCFRDWQVFVDLTKGSHLSRLPKASVWGPEVQGSPHLRSDSSGEAELLRRQLPRGSAVGKGELGQLRVLKHFLLYGHEEIHCRKILGG